MSEKQNIIFPKVLEDASFWSRFECEEKKPLGYGDPDFMYGVATSMYQDSGGLHCPESQWHDWEKRALPSEDQSGSSVNLFELYQANPEEIIKRLELLGVNTYRFSIEWSHIEPECGVYNEEIIDVYVDFCKVLRDHDIEPMITLHHFSEPLWFHKMGSFEKKKNIAYFEEFCCKVFPKLIQEYKGETLVRYFFTINEPGIEAYLRYINGYFSPNLSFRFKRGARFLLNLLKSHCRVYSRLKAIANERERDDVKIGITHQYLKFYPTHFLMHPVVNVLNKFNLAILEFFRTGRFRCTVPFLCHVVENYHNNEEPKLDFAGIQFYGRIFLGPRGVSSLNKPETTMVGVFEDPEGLYEAITVAHGAFQVPIIVSENGISTECDEQRKRYISRALVAAEEARAKIGAENMFGYILWSFCDNFEWFLGWKPRFGVFPLTADRTLSGTYKDGAQPFVDTIAAWRKTSQPIRRNLLL